MAQASAAPSLGAPSTVIAGRYQVERLLGQGGMGSVYAVIDTSNGARVALKRLPATAREKATALFEREYRTLAGLRHPCIVEVYDYGTDADGAYYTMELVDGKDLSTRSPLPWRTACAYLRDAASILGVLHARRLLHRDLSPRNLIVNQSGRLKLIDFGALAEFGPASDVVGTPPFVSPEALRTAPLDQRSDLFALGALGYWLITGSNAFPARSLNDLPQLWQREPAPASAVVQLIADGVLEPPPHELDDLLTALLRVDPRERLSGTAELIARLTTIAELPPESADLAIQGYLQSKAFVGRERERERFTLALDDARTGHGQALLIEGDAGVGRSRFLQEAALLAQLDGALTISADAARGRRPYALAEHVLTRFLHALPDDARAACAAHASVLAHISPALCTQLGVGRLSQVAMTASEQRVRLQSALLEVISALAAQHYTALVVDDIEAVDQESQALLGALAHRASKLKLVLALSLGHTERLEPSPAIASLRTVATRLRLLPLTQPETRELLRSVFGEVPYLDRLAERLHRSADGNPAHCLELARFLVQSGAARYEEGSWVLPTDLPAEGLPRSRQAGLLSRLDRLPSLARSVAQRLSVPHGGSWTLAEVSAACELTLEQTHDLLQTLEREEIVRGQEHGFSFTHADLREALYGELTPPELQKIHEHVAQAMLREGPAGDPAVWLRACTHFLRADDLRRAYPLLKGVLDHYYAGDLSTLSTYATQLEEIYVLLRDAGQDDHALAGPLALLAIAGYFVDRRYAARYGDTAIATLQRVLKMDLASKLKPYLGGKLSLSIALMIAAVGIMTRRWRCAPLAQCIRYLLSAASSLSGTAAVCIDPDSAARYARVIEPFTALGREHAATLVHDFSMLMSVNSRGRTTRAAQALRAMITRLDRASIARLPNSVKVNYTAGCWFALGVIEGWRDTPEGLEIADRLEQFSPLYAMSADQLRANYFAGQGDLERAQACRRRLEVHALQLGSAWQVETWAPADAIKIAMRINDASLLKRAVQELDRLATDLPSMQRMLREARVSYLVLRGKYKQAVELAETAVEVPFAIVGWVRTRGTLARAYNGLGRHEEAREICHVALRDMDVEDREYVVQNLATHVELALAEANLGRHALAHTQLQKLYEQHEPNHSPITLGTLLETRARVALLQREFEQARELLERARQLFMPLGIATLIERVRTLARLIDRTENPKGISIESDGHRLEHVNHVLTRVQLMLSQQAGTVIEERAQRCVQIALELSSADEGFLVLADSEGEPIAHLGSGTPEPELVNWAEQSMLDADVDAQTVMTEEVDSQFDSNYKVVGTKRYCVMPLWARQGGRDGVVAALVLAFDNRVPKMPEPQVLLAIANHLIAV